MHHDAKYCNDGSALTLAFFASGQKVLFRSIVAPKWDFRSDGVLTAWVYSTWTRKSWVTRIDLLKGSKKSSRSFVMHNTVSLSMFISSVPFISLHTPLYSHDAPLYSSYLNKNIRMMTTCVFSWHPSLPQHGYKSHATQRLLDTHCTQRYWQKSRMR